MGYQLEAIIGKEQTLGLLASGFKNAQVVALAQGMAIIPLTDELYDEIADGGEVDHFYKLSPGIEAWTARISAVAPIAYIEADFLGGFGTQGAVAWRDGSRALGPIHAPDAINQTLRFFGVQVNGVRDEFEAVGLHRHRHTDDWILSATE